MVNVRQVLRENETDYWSNVDRAALVVAFGSVAVAGPGGLPVVGTVIGLGAVVVLAHRWYVNEVKRNGN